jgi:hypothetical protein
VFCAVQVGVGGAAAALPEPTEAELEELYQAVDFHPEEEVQQAAAAAGRAGAGAAFGLHLSLDCLISSASLMLLEAPVAAAAAVAPPPAGERAQEEQQQPGAQQELQQGMQQAPQVQQPHQDAEDDAAAGGAEDWPDSPPNSEGLAEDGGSSDADGNEGSSGSRSIAALELERLRLALRVHPNKSSASVSLAEASLHDLCSEGPGVSAQLLARSTLGAAAAAAAAPAGVDDEGSAPRGHPPLLRLQYTADASAAEAAEAGHQQQERRPQLDVLVQPLLLRLRPLCLQRLMALVPPVVQVGGGSSKGTWLLQQPSCVPHFSRGTGLIAIPVLTLPQPA